VLASFGAATAESVGIIGGRRIGKTSLLLEIKKRIELVGGRIGVAPNQTIPVYVDFQEDVPSSRRTFFQSVFRNLVQQTESTGALLALPETALFANQDEDDAVRDFKDSFLMLINHGSVKPTQRFAILMDEMDVLISKGWVLEILANLRHILSASSVQNRLVVVLAGSEILHLELQNKASPLHNILRATLQLRVLAEPEVDELIALSSVPVSKEQRAEILRLTGGHPMLVQYLLRRLNEDQPSSLGDAAKQFSNERDDFRTWTKHHFSQTAIEVFSVLASEHRLLSLRYVVAKLEKMISDGHQITDPGVKTGIGLIDQTKSALEQLRYFGTIRFEKQEGPFAVAGDMFSDWFLGSRDYGQVRISSRVLEMPAFRTVLDAICRDRCLIFLGSVCHLPPRIDVLAKLCQQNRISPSKNLDDILRNYLMETNREAVCREVAQLVETTTKHVQDAEWSIHRLIARAIAIRKIITTDWGSYLTTIRTSEPFREIYDDHSGVSLTFQNRILIKLYGSAKEYRSLILLPEEYEYWKRANPALSTVVLKLLRENALVLTGFTREDELLQNLYNAAWMDWYQNQIMDGPIQSSTSNVYGVGIDTNLLETSRWAGQKIQNIPVSLEEFLFELLNIEMDDSD